MKLPLLLSAAFISCTIALAESAEATKLEPNAQITFEFPDLPATYHAQKTADKRPPTLSAQLPENYTPEGKFPLFVFLGGGDGGAGMAASFARYIIGPRDFIAVNLPLFKAAVDKDHPLPKVLGLDVSGLINMGDTTLLSRAYRVMLEKLLTAVPNITADRSTLGGFSNGAHATGLLVAAQDEFIMAHFTAFCCLEGGQWLALNPAALQNPAWKKCRMIYLFGDHDENPDLQSRRDLVSVPLMKTLEEKTRTGGWDFTFITMHGYGHAQPPEYLRLIGNWTRGEPLPEIAPKAPATGKP